MSSTGPGHRLRARLEHASPGRIRVRVDKEHRRQDLMEAVGRRLHANYGVQSVEVNPATGSILVQGADTHSLRAALNGAFSIVERAKQEGVGEMGVESAVSLIKQLDRKLSDATGRRISIRWAVPAVFVTVGMRQAVVQGFSIGVIPWYVLLYYGVDSFLKLFPEYAPQAPPQGQTEQTEQDHP